LHSELGYRIYAGLKPGVNAAWVRRLLADGGLTRVLHALEPRPGDCVYLPAGTVHAIGAGLMIFEVQQTSDITYRLHDWNRVDPKTGRPRELHVEKALACIDFGSGPRRPTWPALDHAGPVERERLAQCEYFRL